eukprot:8394537-Pyramimonas_sp.AAC.1
MADVGRTHQIQTIELQEPKIPPDESTVLVPRSVLIDRAELRSADAGPATAIHVQVRKLDNGVSKLPTC